MTMKRMNFYLADLQIRRLKAINKKTGLPLSDILRRAIDEYWERFESKVEMNKRRKVEMKKILLLLTVVSLLVPISVNCQSTLALQEKCVEGAKKLVLETGGCDQVKSYDDYLHSCEYRCHYNKKLDKCFLLWDFCNLYHKGSKIPEALRHTRHIDVVDVFERGQVGRYNNSITFGDCWVGDKKCNSLEEFEALIKPYMEE
jgi:hypothetical protein